MNACQYDDFGPPIPPSMDCLFIVFMMGAAFGSLFATFGFAIFGR